MKLKDIPPKFVKIYNIKKIAAPDGTIYVKIQKGMYGLPQAGILAQNLLKEQLNKHGYHQSPTTRASGNAIGTPSPSPSASTILA
jgi:hypothetical protein